MLVSFSCHALLANSYSHIIVLLASLSVSVRAIIIMLNENTQCFCDNDNSYDMYMTVPQTVIAAAETSAPTECAFTSFQFQVGHIHHMLKLKHQDVLTNSTMLHTWGVLQIESIRVHYLTRCLGGSKIQRNVKWNVTRRDISILLGRGEANAFVAILYVSNEGEE